MLTPHILQPEMLYKIDLPLFLTKVEAGFPSPADDYIEDKLDLNQLMVKRPAATFFVRVSGQSMVGAGIQHNDILVVDRSIKASHKAIVVASVNGEFTVKRYYVEANKQILKPENPKFKPIVINENDQFEVWGVVTYVIHQAR